MRIPRLLFIVLAVALVGGALGIRATSESPTVSALDSTDGHGRPEPPMLGIHYARNAKPGGSARPSPNLSWHGGDVMPTATVIPIYWGVKWSDPSFFGDKIDGLTSFYGGVGGSKYIGTNTEYHGLSINFAATGPISSSTGYVDASSAGGNGNTTAVLNEVIKVLTANHVTPSPGGYYPVYSDAPRGNANYCAYHSWGTMNGVNIQFAFFFNLDGDTGCYANTAINSQSSGLAALANVSGHEISEAVTDPRGASWYDSRGAENADKCAWTFGSSPLTFANGSQWVVQGNWSNAAYNANKGYQRGCIDGN